MSRPTAQTVADAAGVSRTAVSFAFNDPSKIAPETQARILAAAEELGYTPNPLGRMLTKGTTHALGLLLPQSIPDVFDNPYYSQFIRGLGQVCHREGLTLLLTPPLRGSMLTAIPYAAVDGFVVSGLQVDRGEVAALGRRGVPFVLVDSNAPEGVASVDVNDREGMASIVRHVLELGHRRIAFLAFEAGPDSADVGYTGPLGRRVAGLEDALREAGLSLQSDGVDLIEVACTRAAGYDATREQLARPDPPTAIVTFSDIIALGALDAARDAGADVPGAVSITGFDDQPEATFVRPQLTTVRQSIESKGRVAGDFLVAAIRGDDQPHHHVLHVALMVRESTGPAPTHGR